MVNVYACCHAGYLRSIRRIGRNSRTILYWGEPKALINFSRQLTRNQWVGYRIAAWFSPINVNQKDLPDNVPRCSGGIDELRDWLDRNNANCIVFSNTETLKNIWHHDLFNLLATFQGFFTHLMVY